MLPLDVTSYAELFRRAGYRTACLSANPFVSPLTGLDRGFDLAEWGQFSDCFLRFQGTPRPIGRTGRLVGQSESTGQRRDRDLALQARDSIRQMTTRFPLPAELLVQASRISKGQTRAGLEPKVSGWIEADLEKFLSGAPRDVPVFVVVNLLEAHEPYFGVLNPGTTSIPDWLWAFSGPLDKSSWREGRASPSVRDVTRIRRLYRAAAESLDRRLGSVLDTFASARDPVLTDVAVMGDHGQALGEQGSIYHVTGTATSLLRVPLVIRSGSGEGRGRIGTWVSLEDSIRLLVSHSPGVGSALGLAAGDLVGMVDGLTEPMAAALVDGPPPSDSVVSHELPTHASSSRGRAVVVFSGELKVVIDLATGSASINDASSDAQGVELSPDDRSNPGFKLYERAVPLVAQVRECLRQGDSSTQEKRLASWGY